MEDEHVIVTLRRNEFVDNQVILEKAVFDCENKTFGSVLDYMLDPREDSHGHAYSSREREVCDAISAYRKADGRYERFLLTYLDANENPVKQISEPNKTKVGKYPDAIILKRERGEFGENKTRRYLELVADTTEMGG